MRSNDDGIVARRPRSLSLFSTSTSSFFPVSLLHSASFQPPLSLLACSQNNNNFSTHSFRSVLKKILQSKLQMGGAMRGASFALAQAKYSAGDFRATVQDNVGSATCRVRSATDNVAGVKIPRFERSIAGGGGGSGGGSGNNASAPSSHPIGGGAGGPSSSSGAAASSTTAAASGAPRTDLTGLGRGGQQVSLARAAFLDAVSLLVELASLQTAFVTLDAAIKTTNRRVNALDNVVRPRLEATIAYIKGELDELEREEFFRLKKVQAKKKRDAAAKAEAAEVVGAHRTSGGAGEKSVSALLGVEADADVVF